VSVNIILQVVSLRLSYT